MKTKAELQFIRNYHQHKMWLRTCTFSMMGDGGLRMLLNEGHKVPIIKKNVFHKLWHFLFTLSGSITLLITHSQQRSLPPTPSFLSSITRKIDLLKKEKKIQLRVKTSLAGEEDQSACEWKIYYNQSVKTLTSTLRIGLLWWAVFV